jgi:hypothetical protein
VRVGVTRSVVYVSTFGVAHQRPSFFVPVPGLQISELKPSLQSSVQTSQGIEVALPAEVTASMTGFVHQYFGMTDLTQTCISDRGDLPKALCVDDRVRGRAYGVEVYLRRALTKRLTGWISYTLSRAERQAHDPLSLAADSTTWIPSEFDRTHVLSAVGALDLGSGWRGGARFYYDSGRPYSQTSLGIAIPPYDSLRLPSFWRVDVRLEKQWRIGETTRVAFVLEGLNVTLNKEAVSIQCVSSRSSLIDDCKPEYIGPVTVPSVGGEVYW